MNHLANILEVCPRTGAVGYEASRFMCNGILHRIVKFVAVGFSLSEADRSYLKNQIDPRTISFIDSEIYSNNDIKAIVDEFAYIHNILIA